VEQRRTRYVHDRGNRRLRYLFAKKNLDFRFFAIEPGLAERTLRPTGQIALGLGCRQPYFKMVDGRPKLGRQAKKPVPLGLGQLDKRLAAKLDALDLSLLDVLTDTMQWLGWDEHFSLLSGHQGKLKEDAKRKILTAFAYGTGLGST